MKQFTEAKFRKLMGTIKVPEGFTAEFENETWMAFKGEEKHLNFVVKSDTVTITFNDDGRGHTEFTKDGTPTGTRLTFDRRGVEDSFYWQDWNDKVKAKAELDQLIPEQLARVAESRKYYLSAIPLPGTPFTVSPQGLIELKKEMQKANGHRSFMPSGFGTGYILMRRPRNPRYRGDRGAPRAKPELETLLGVSPVYVDTFDAD